VGVFGAVSHSDGSDGRGGSDRDEAELHEDDAWWLREREPPQLPGDEPVEGTPEKEVEPAAVAPIPPQPEPEQIKSPTRA